MATVQQMKDANLFVSIIQREGPINRYDLMDKLSWSISKYNQMKQYIEHRFGHYVEYDKKSKQWNSKEVRDIEQKDQTLDQETDT